MNETMPARLQLLLRGHTYRLDDIGMSHAQVRIYDDRVLKMRPQSRETETEHTMLQYLQGKLPVPQVLYHAVCDGTDDLLMTHAPGQMACDPTAMADPVGLAEALAGALHALWQVDAGACPVQQGLQVKLAEAARRVQAGLVDVEDCEPDTFGPGGFAHPQALLAYLQANRPPEETVLTHGDFCLPNIFLQQGRLSALIDLGRAGVADPYQDIALCWRSLQHNYSGRYARRKWPGFDPDMLFAALGITPDREKLRYYILLDELF